MPKNDDSTQTPSTKPDLVAAAIEAGVPSYEAWDMTVTELRKILEEDS